VKLNDAVFGLLLLALGLTVVVVAASFPTVPAQRVGPALFPTLIAIGLAGGGVILIVRGWRQRARIPVIQWDAWVQSPRHVAGFMAVIGSVAFYLAAVDRLGFLLTSFTLLVVLFRVFGVAWSRAFAVSAVASFAIHFAFYKLLRVPLPWGVLTGYAW
jgi:putative tricarboxylic transport membrane protein